MASVLMSLGDILFYSPVIGTDMIGFETVSREMTANLAVQPRLNRDTAIQFTGPGEEVISIRGRAFPYLFGGLTTLDGIREALRAGKPLKLVQYSNSFNEQPSMVSGVTYSGLNVGNYMIRSFKKQSSLFTKDAIPMKIDFTLDLVLYGDDV